MATGVTIWQGAQIFSVVFLLLFSTVLFIGGVFSAYFGKGKSRRFGLILIVTAMIIGGGFAMIAGPLDMIAIPVLEIAIKGVLYIASGATGALLALIIFLMFIVRT